MRLTDGSSGLGAKTGPGIFHLGQPICRKALSFTAVIFLPDSHPILLHRAAAAHQMYTIGLVVGYAPTQHSPYPYCDFYRGS